jgi:hypothetical protein
MTRYRVDLVYVTIESTFIDAVSPEDAVQETRTRVLLPIGVAELVQIRVADAETGTPLLKENVGSIDI